MKITIEQSLTSFNFWSGAKNNVAYLTYSELQELEPLLGDIYPEGLNETILNDILWHDFETICEWLRLDIDEVYGR